MSDLVGNPEDRFSQNEAQIIGHSDLHCFLESWVILTQKPDVMMFLSKVCFTLIIRWFFLCDFAAGNRI